MNTLTEIEQAIETLPARDVEALAAWLENRRQQLAEGVPFEKWLERARGAAVPGTTTAGILAMTRGEE